MGLRIQLGKTAAKTKETAIGAKRRASQQIRKTIKRVISYQIEDITTAINMALNPDAPDRSRLHSIYAYIQRDGRLKSQLRTARIKVKSEPWMWYRDDTPDEEVSKLFRKTWFGQIIDAIIDAEWHGYSVVELDVMDAAQCLVGTVTVLERQHVSIEKQWILIEGTINGSYFSYADIKNELDLVEFGRRDNLGTLLESSYNVLWKFYARSDWSRASEKVGMPILNVEANTNNDDELDAIETAAANFGTDGYIVTQSGDKVSMIERKSDRLHDIFLDNIKYCDEENTLITNGQTASSDQKSFVGSAEVQERTMEDYTTDRLQKVADEINTSFVPYLIAKGFPVEGLTFDYPELRRTRERKIIGQPVATDAPDAPEEKKADNKPADKKKGGK